MGFDQITVLMRPSRLWLGRRRPCHPWRCPGSRSPGWKSLTSRRTPPVSHDDRTICRQCVATPNIFREDTAPIQHPATPIQMHPPTPENYAGRSFSKRSCPIPIRQSSRQHLRWAGHLQGTLDVPRQMPKDLDSDLSSAVRI